MTVKRSGIVLGILLSVVGLVYTFPGVDLGRVLTEVQHLRGGPFWLSQGFFLLMIVLRALRWRYLLLKLKRFSLWGSASCVRRLKSTESRCCSLLSLLSYSFLGGHASCNCFLIRSADCSFLPASCLHGRGHFISLATWQP